MNRSRRLLSLGLAAATLPTLLGVTAASAADRPRLTSVTSSSPTSTSLTSTPANAVKPAVARIQQHGDDAINQRLSTLKELTADVTSAKYLTATDRSNLLGQIGADTTGLTQLKATIDANTNPATLIPEVQSIVTAYRVYVELEPKVHLIRAADFVLQLTGTITPLEPKLQAAITARKLTGAAEAYTDLAAKVAAAEQLVTGLSSQLAALVPSQYPSPAQSTLKSARQNIGLSLIHI